MLIDNIDVKKRLANGSIGRFKGITLKHGLNMANLDTLLIDGYYVRYAKVDQIQSIQLELVQDLLKTNKGKIINLEPKEYYAKVKFPMTFESKLRHNTPRPINKKIK